MELKDRKIAEKFKGRHRLHPKNAIFSQKDIHFGNFFVVFFLFPSFFRFLKNSFLMKIKDAESKGHYHL